MAMNVLVVGGGKVGASLVSMLMAEGYTARLIEQRREQVAVLVQSLPAELVVLGSGTDPDVLEAAGIRKADVVAAVTGDDETNLVVASLARSEFGVPRVIGRVNNPRNAWMFTPQMGVDVALNQAELMARLIAEEMSLGDMMTLLKLRKGLFSLVEEKVAPESTVVGMALRSVALPEDSVLIAVIRKGELLLPSEDLVFQPADEVLALVKSGRKPELGALLSGRRA